MAADAPPGADDGGDARGPGPGAFEVGLSRWPLVRRIFWLSLLGAGLLIGGFFLLGEMVTDPAWSLAQLVALWLFVAYVAVVGAVDTARVAAMRGSVLRLDPDGFVDRRIMRAPLPWRDVRRAEVRTLQGRPILIGFWAKRARTYRLRPPLWGYFGLIYVLEAMAAPFRFAPLSIDLQPLTADPEQVIDFVRRHWGEPTRRALAPRRPPPGVD